MKLIINNISFQAIELKGDILPPSLLEDLAKLDISKNLFIDNKNYDLKNNERIRDQIDSAWILSNELWKEFNNLKSYSNLELSGLHFAKRFEIRDQNYNIYARSLAASSARCEGSSLL